MVSAATTLKDKALQLLAARDYTRAEMQSRLLRWLRARAATASAAPAPGSSASAPRHGAHGETGGETGGEIGGRAGGRAGGPAPHALGQHPRIAANHGGQEEDDPHALQQQWQTAIATLLDALEGQGLLSDQRTAQALVRRQTARMGAFRIRQSLQSKGVDAGLAASLIQELRSTEVARAHALWQKKFNAPPATPAERAKHMRYLASRGFAADTIHKVLRGEIDEPEA